MSGQSCGSFGPFFKMAVVDSGETLGSAVFDQSSERYNILGENVGYPENLVGDNGLTGFLEKFANQLREGVRFVAGTFLMEMGPYELSQWLPRILRKQASGDTYETGDESLPFDMLFVRDQGIARYNGCEVARALFRSASRLDGGEEQILQVLITVIGRNEVITGVEWPSPEPTVADLAEPFWMISDTTFELGDDEYPIDAFNLLIDNNLQPLARNSPFLTCIRSNGRDIRLQVPTPLTTSSYEALYENRYDGPGVLKFDALKNLAPESYESTFAFTRLVQQRQTPSTRGRAEIPLSLDLTAYRTVSQPALIVTNTLGDSSSI